MSHVGVPKRQARQTMTDIDVEQRRLLLPNSSLSSFTRDNLGALVLGSLPSPGQQGASMQADDEVGGGVTWLFGGVVFLL